MEYSKDCAIPYLSRVDAGTIELVRSHGVEVVSSGDLIQRFEAVWDDAALATHRDASVRLYRIKDRALAFVRAALAAGRPSPSTTSSRRWSRRSATRIWWPTAPRSSARRATPATRTTSPPPRRIAPIGRDEVLLLDLWGKRPSPGAVYADITWMAFTGPTVPAPRPGGVDGRRRRPRRRHRLRPGRHRRRADRPRLRSRRGRPPGADRRRLRRHVLHRTGHSLGQEIHGNGVHMDDYETHDDRRLVPGLGFTIEPGLYFDDFGIRTEIDMTVGLQQATVTGDIQRQIETLA